jgi:NADH:ubiquinone oxidoreductase subunit F (NADH-binding)
MESLMIEAMRSTAAADAHGTLRGRLRHGAGCHLRSCGKCIPCRAGTVRMDQLLAQISAGNATRRDLDRLETLCDVVKHTSLSGLGQAAPNPVLSTRRYCRHEYLPCWGSQRAATPSRLGESPRARL